MSLCLHTVFRQTVRNRTYQQIRYQIISTTKKQNKNKHQAAAHLQDETKQLDGLRDHAVISLNNGREVSTQNYYENIKLYY